MVITPDDVVEYCDGNGALFLVHGTTDDTVNDFIEDGLAINENNIANPTVLMWSSGTANDGSKISEYVWYEPHACDDYEDSCCVIFEVPRMVLEDIRNAGQVVNQENIFKRICKNKIMTVPDNRRTREQHEFLLHGDLDEDTNGLDPLPLPTFGPKYCKYGAEPGSKFVGFGVPPEYILAITSAKKVYYAGNKLKNYIAKREGLNVHLPTIESYLSLIVNKDGKESNDIYSDVYDMNETKDDSIPTDSTPDESLPTDFPRWDDDGQDPFGFDGM